MKIFLESIYNHSNDLVTIVIPSRGDLENYVMSLETEYCKLYNHYPNKVTYVRYRDYKRDLNIETDSIIIIDPRCYLEEIKMRDEQLTKIYEEIKTIWNYNQNQ